jgi:hypothetical protein
VFAPYAEAAFRLAEREIEYVAARADPGAERARAEAVEDVIIGTVVFEVALVALRRLAQEHHSASRFASEG